MTLLKCTPNCHRKMAIIQFMKYIFKVETNNDCINEIYYRQKMKLKELYFSLCNYTKHSIYSRNKAISTDYNVIN